MSYLGSWKIDDNLTFACNTHDPDTGVATDADAVPTYRVYEDETAAAILTGSMAKLDDANTTGFYSEQIALTAANGFEKGKCYTIYISATVDGDTGTMHHTFQMEAEVDANTASGLHADWQNGGRLDLLIDSIVAAAGTAAAYAKVNSGLAFRGTVTAADPGVSFTIAGLAGLGAGMFADANSPWYAYVLRDDGGVAGAPQGEQKKVTGYTSATGLFTTEAFTAAVAVDDDVMIMSNMLAPTAMADTILKRGVANVEDTADMDSLAAVILKELHAAIAGTTLTIYKVDDATTFDTKTITKSASAEPVTGIADP